MERIETPPPPPLSFAGQFLTLPDFIESTHARANAEREERAMRQKKDQSNRLRRRQKKTPVVVRMTPADRAAAVLAILRKNGKMSRLEIQKAAGYTRSTTAEACRMLVDLKQAREEVIPPRYKTLIEAI